MIRNFGNNKKAISTMVIAVIVIVVIAVAGIGAYALVTQNAAPSASPSPTTTPSGSVAPTSTAPSASSTENPPTPSASTPVITVAPPTATPAQGVTVAGASSLKYSVSLTVNGVSQGSYTYYGKNAGTNNFMMRIDYTGPDGDAVYIFNGAQQKAWTYSDGEWTDISAMYAAQYPLWNGLWNGYVNSLSAWAGVGDYSYSAEGSTVRIYDISVNPALEDSLFVH